MKKKIRYIMHYDADDKEGRYVALAAKNKADYIMDTLVDLGYTVEIISASVRSENKNFRGGRTSLAENKMLTKLPALKRKKNIFRKIFMRLWDTGALFFYLLFQVKRHEEVIVYHSLGLLHSVGWAKKIKGFKLVLEVEEIYNDVIMKSERARRKELRFISLADKYIFPTELLNSMCNTENKPYTIIHGTYKNEAERGENCNDGKIHVVYAGTFDPRKGVFAAVAAAEYLPESYHVHVIGFGNAKETENIKKTVYKTNERAKATITYDGRLTGEGYVRFLQKCQIGLSTQNPDADFNATSFPSKILSYMANGLRVVSVRIPAIESSAIGKDMYYYEEQSPKEIAKAVLAIDLKDGYDSRKKISSLHKRFIQELSKLIGA